MLKRKSNLPRKEIAWPSKSEKPDNSEDQRYMLGWRDDVHVELKPFIYVVRFHVRRYKRD